MKIKILLFILSINFAYSAENRIKIAVIDTGVSEEISKQKYMCQNSNLSVVDDDIAYDQHGHGSNIISAIGENIDSNKYCIVSYRALDSSASLDIFVKRIEIVTDDIIKKHIRFVNMSIVGEEKSENEFEIIKRLEKHVTVLSIAAGNSQKNLDLNCNAYPACYNKVLKSKRIHIVGSFTKSYSNYGSVVKYLEVGIWKDMHGTSQSSALHLAKVIRKL